jgi:hypothetical protein
MVGHLGSWYDTLTTPITMAASGASSLYTWYAQPGQNTALAQQPGGASWTAASTLDKLKADAAKAAADKATGQVPSLPTGGYPDAVPAPPSVPAVIPSGRPGPPPWLGAVLGLGGTLIVGLLVVKLLRRRR